MEVFSEKLLPIVRTLSESVSSGSSEGLPVQAWISAKSENPIEKIAIYLAYFVSSISVPESSHDVPSATQLYCE